MFRKVRLLQFPQIKSQICRCSNLPKKPEEKMPRELTDLSEISSKEMAKYKFENDKSVEWRTPWHKKEGQYYSFLRGFHSDDSHIDLLKFLTSQLTVNPFTIRDMWRQHQKDKRVFMQHFIEERNQKLGDELAAAHFIVHRDGAVKFFGEERWKKKDDSGNYELPAFFESDIFIQAIDCSDMELYYEGLANLKNLRQVEWLSFNGCEDLDDWALDRISAAFAHSLLYLDLRNMPLITHRGLGALYKMEKLKILYIDNKFYSEEIEMVGLMLQDINHDLDIRMEN